MARVLTSGGVSVGRVGPKLSGCVQTRTAERRYTCRANFQIMFPIRRVKRPLLKADLKA